MIKNYVIKEKLNDIICQSSSDYDVLNDTYNYIEQLEQQCKKQKEVIAKIYELIKQHIRKDIFLELNEWQTMDLLKLLKEVSE